MLICMYVCTNVHIETAVPLQWEVELPLVLKNDSRIVIHVISLDIILYSTQLYILGTGHYISYAYTFIN